MITLFEEYKLEPKVGDYVYTPNGALNKDIGHVLNTTPGEIILIKDLGTFNGNSYIIKYTCDVTNLLKYDLIRGNNDGKSFKIELGRVWIKFFSKNKEDVEDYITAKKYNL